VKVAQQVCLAASVMGVLLSLVAVRKQQLPNFVPPSLLWTSCEEVQYGVQDFQVFAKVRMIPFAESSLFCCAATSLLQLVYLVHESLEHPDGFRPAFNTTRHRRCTWDGERNNTLIDLSGISPLYTDL